MTVINPYVHSGVRKIEIDLRQELDNILFGYNGEIPKGRPFIIRHFRRDGNNKRIQCSVCNHPGTGESSSKYRCSYCDGEGYLWDESIVIGYRMEESPVFRFFGERLDFGEAKMISPFIFLRYDAIVDEEDILIEPVLTKDGHIVSPLAIKQKYRIPWAREFRLDNSRVEYVKIRITEVPK